jgi:hypothetical protein
LFSSLAFFFFFEEEKKKLYRKIKEKKTLYRYPKNCLLVRCVSLLIQQTHKQKKPFFLRLGIENKEKKNFAVSKKQR